MTPKTERPAERTDLYSSLSGELGDRSGYLTGVQEASAALVFAALFRDRPGHYLWLCRNNRESERVSANLRFFLPGQLAKDVITIPGSEADPYRGLSPHPEILIRRAVGLWTLRRAQVAFVVTTLPALAMRLPAPDRFTKQCLQIEVGEELPRETLVERLRENGYISGDPVSGPGEFSMRGGIVDIFSPSRSRPVRIELFGDEVESIREFDPATQRSVELIHACEAIPMNEMTVSRAEIAMWHQSAPQYWNEVRFAPALEEKMQFTQDGELFNGYEALFPLVVDTPASLFDYRPGHSGSPWKIVFDDFEETRLELDRRFWQLRKDFEERASEGDLVLPPVKLMRTSALLDAAVQDSESFFIGLLTSQADPFAFDFRPEVKYKGRLPELISQIARWRQAGERVVLVMSTLGTAERMKGILAEYDLLADFAEPGFELIGPAVTVTYGDLSGGFSSPALKLHVLTQDHVFEESGKPARRTQRERSRIFLSDFRDLKPGDYVVHIDHGIGQFHGLKQIGVADHSREFVELVYRNNAKLYVPVDRLDLLQKYSSMGAGSPQLDKLGGASWSKAKTRIKKAMRDMAEELLKLYAKRALSKGHAFDDDDEMSREFEDVFEFDETPDQMEAILAVKKDMESVTPMDRLVCGDVGYGKTEVAMRAAFKAVNGGFQVAILAPTTVLTMQHFNTFRARFQGFPVEVDHVSRFRSRAEQKEALRRTECGQVDILIGTHRILSKDVSFHQLGLIVIDEEQRFGVAHKERLKKLRTKVDVLTLSATPIPRTLNMGMMGLRDLSIIETPPKDRLAIQTVVMKFNRPIIRSAIDMEMKREGQVFFLHNKVDTIDSIAKMVQEIAPEARVGVAHGQMREADLERVMLDFLQYKYDVLVSTTIIENGLDIPRANTLIVNRADRFGLSQLYQLRGRVGRSNRRAYAYLVIPSEETLSTEARRRLKAIRDFSDLGAGFRIAALDLEIRGAGNLLGGEQHGHINAIGFELYTKLLEQEIRKLKGAQVDEIPHTSIELGIDIQIPDHYIEDANVRLSLYKRISAAEDDDALRGLEAEITDRHGQFPRSLSNLFEYARLRRRAGLLKILSIERKGGGVLFKFHSATPLSAEKIVDLVNRDDRVNLHPDGAMSMSLPPDATRSILEPLDRFLDELSMLQ